MIECTAFSRLVLLRPHPPKIFWGREASNRLLNDYSKGADYWVCWCEGFLPSSLSPPVVIPLSSLTSSHRKRPWNYENSQPPLSLFYFADGIQNWEGKVIIPIKKGRILDLHEDTEVGGGAGREGVYLLAWLAPLLSSFPYIFTTTRLCHSSHLEKEKMKAGRPWTSRPDLCCCKKNWNWEADCIQSWNISMCSSLHHPKDVEGRASPPFRAPSCPHPCGLCICTKMNVLWPLPPHTEQGEKATASNLPNIPRKLVFLLHGQWFPLKRQQHWTAPGQRFLELWTWGSAREALYLF